MGIRLAACYNVYDGVELLAGSMRSIAEHVYLFIIVYQDKSNFGETGFNPLQHVDLSEFHNVELIKYTPRINAGHKNETEKRNIGIRSARSKGCTHFIHLDVDEYYKDFGEAKEAYIQSGSEGSVVGLYTYFKRPEWMFEKPDSYYVPFIHKLKGSTHAGAIHYPFRVDPTRRINTKTVSYLPHYMHHFSWIRNDVQRKIRNSSARNNMRMNQILEAYNSPLMELSPEGYYVAPFEQKITVVDNYFNIKI